MVERVEELRANLKARAFGHDKFAHQRHVERLQAGAVDRVPSGIAEGVSRRCGKGRGIEPVLRCFCTGPEDRQPGIVGASGEGLRFRVLNVGSVLVTPSRRK